jgi:hypothetical protein
VYLKSDQIMNLDIKKRMAEGFTHSYLRIEQKMVVKFLRTGKLAEDTWHEFVERLDEVRDSYESGELEGEDFLAKRQAITKRIREVEDEGASGLTKEEAINLYKPIRDRQEEALNDAHRESSSVSKIFYKTVSNKFSLTLTQLKNI